MGVIDYKYALELVSKVNDSKVGGKLVSEAFIFEGVNYWYFYQSSIFAEAKNFSLTREIPHNYPLNFNGFLVSVFLLLFSFFSLVFFFFQKKRFLVFSPDTVTGRYLSDFRMKDVYEGLYKNEVKFFEIFHTIPSIKALKNIVRRRRPALYLQSVDFLQFIFGRNKKINLEKIDTKSQNEKERKFLEYVVKKYSNLIGLSQFRISFFEKVFNFNKTKAIFLIDDTRNYNEIIVAARKVGTQSWAFQHGHFTKYHVGWLKQNWAGIPAKPDLFFVWSEYWKKELKLLGGYFDEESIVVAGRGHNPEPPNKIKSEKISVLIPYETDAPKQTVKEYIDLLKKCGFGIYFKIRPDRDKQKQLDEYGLNPAELVVVRNVKEALPEISVVGGIYSTFLYDMVALEIPVFIMDSEMDYGLGMVENNMATLLNKESLCEGVKGLSKMEKEKLSKKREILVASKRSFIEIFSDKLKTLNYT